MCPRSRALLAAWQLPWSADGGHGAADHLTPTSRGAGRRRQGSPSCTCSRALSGPSRGQDGCLARRPTLEGMTAAACGHEARVGRGSCPASPTCPCPSRSTCLRRAQARTQSQRGPRHGAGCSGRGGSPVARNRTAPSAGCGQAGSAHLTNARRGWGGLLPAIGQLWARPAGSALSDLTLAA